MPKVPLHVFQQDCERCVYLTQFKYQDNFCEHPKVRAPGWPAHAWLDNGERRCELFYPRKMKESLVRRFFQGLGL